MVRRDVASEPRRGRHGCGAEFGGVIIVGIGLWFLLRNLGWLPDAMFHEFWRALRAYWPILLILAGIELFFRRRAGLGWLVAGVAIIGGLAFFGAGDEAWAGVKSGQVARERGLQIERAAWRDGLNALVIEQPVGILTVGAGDDPNAFVTAMGSLPEGSKLSVSERRNGVTVKPELRAIDRLPFFGALGGGGDDSHIQVDVSPRTKITLRISSGAARSDLDLRRLQIERLDVETGVGEATLQLPTTGVVTGRVRAGVGSLTIEAPTSVGVRLRAHSGVGAISVEPTTWTRNGETYTSPNWATATDRVDLNVELGVGRVTVREIAAEAP